MIYSPTASRRRTLGELDRLVLTELASFQRARDRQRAEALARDDDVSGGADGSVALTPSGTAFVERTVEWIERRADREALLTALWSRLRPSTAVPVPDEAGEAGTNGAAAQRPADVPDATGG